MTIQQLQEISKMLNDSGLNHNVIIGLMIGHMEMTNTLKEFLEKFPQFIENEKRRN